MYICTYVRSHAGCISSSLFPNSSHNLACFWGSSWVSEPGSPVETQRIPICRTPKGHRNIRIPQHMISGMPLILGSRKKNVRSFIGRLDLEIMGCRLPPGVDYTDAHGDESLWEFMRSFGPLIWPACILSSHCDKVSHSCGQLRGPVRWATLKKSVGLSTEPKDPNMA